MNQPQNNSLKIINNMFKAKNKKWIETSLD